MTCGSGVQMRSVKCSDGNSSCDLGSKPQSTKSCNLETCPQWRTSVWSKVKVSLALCNLKLSFAKTSLIDRSTNREFSLPLLFYRYTTVRAVVGSLQSRHYFECWTYFKDGVPSFVSPFTNVLGSLFLVLRYGISYISYSPFKNKIVTK